MSINQTSLRLWVEGEIHKIKFQLELGTILPVVGRAKINLLESLVEDFNLHEIPDEELTYHKNFWSRSDPEMESGQYCSAQLKHIPTWKNY